MSLSDSDKSATYCLASFVYVTNAKAWRGVNKSPQVLTPYSPGVKARESPCGNGSSGTRLNGFEFSLSSFRNASAAFAIAARSLSVGNLNHLPRCPGFIVITHMSLESAAPPRRSVSCFFTDFTVVVYPHTGQVADPRLTVPGPTPNETLFSKISKSILFSLSFGTIFKAGLPPLRESARVPSRGTSVPQPGPSHRIVLAHI